MTKLGHPRWLSRRAHPAQWAELTRMRRLRRATQRMASWQGFDRLRVSKLFKKLQASGIFLDPENTTKHVKASHATEPGSGVSLIQKGKGLFNKVRAALKGGDR